MEITKKQLLEMYQKMTNKELAEKLGVSTVTLENTLKSLGVKLKGKGNRQERKKIKIVE